MVYPNYGGSDHVLENRVDDQDAHIARLEEKNLMVKEFENLREHVCSVWRRGGKEQDLEGLSKRLWRMVLRMKVGVGVLVGRLTEIARLLRRTRIMLLIKNLLMVSFLPKLKEQMQHCVDHPEEISKLSKWQKMSAVEERVRVTGEKVRVADEKVRVKEWDILTVDVDSYPEPKRSTLKKMQEVIMKKYQS
ncbi:hypothetical protein HanRHA438_Chr15g0704221 [Helianthus annuus]|uniref:Uncharacterized protein n=1 Tax=Helianthus annuus TaxID=4232 RepID=A0A9K3DZR4_HELAN|nr:hypothetical protein HanXRQr2_Chr15g0691771 [Helianthus annuus]KAJ0831142.1 hypothetical protein HanPSC8_Chr15g0663611 [Helianthus annuus]KAJ0844595.1 hypothetical protein HanRHA438_Chr15g0704221 [Helianthus annuus]